MANDFSKLDAQDEMSRLAQIRSDEQDPREFDSWMRDVCRDEKHITDADGVQTMLDQG